MNLNLKTAGIKECRRTPPNAILPYLPRWQSNNGPDDLGIARFVFDMFSINKQMGYQPLFRDFVLKYGVAPWAKDALAEYYAYEEGMTKEDMCHVFAAYRGSSKTTWFSQMAPIYEILVGQYGIYYNDTMMFELDYQVLKSKSAKEARKRFMAIASFLNKEIVRQLFGELKPSFQEVKRKDAKDTSDLLILKNGYIVEASGINQPIRGSNILGARPKKVIFDDPQNKDNTKTESSREDCDNEVMNETFGAVTDVGMIVYIGNKIHQDDTIGKLLDSENTQWKKQVHTLTVRIDEKGEVQPGVGDLDNETPAWARRDTIKKIKRRKEWFVLQPKLGGIRGYLKEFYNIIKSEADYVLRYHEGVYLRAFGHNWLVFDTYTGPLYKNVNIYIGNDPAISEKKKSCPAVISVTAVDSDFKRYVLEYSSGNFDIHDRFYDIDYEPSNKVVAITPQELAKVKRKGSTEEILRMNLKYHADGIVVETAAVQSVFFNELVHKKEKLRMSVPIMPYPGGSGEKTEKNRECPLAFFEQGIYYIKKDMVKLESEVNSFPGRQDHLDALRMAEQVMSCPEPIKYDPRGIINPTEFKIEPTEPALTYGRGDGNFTKEVESWICQP